MPKIASIKTETAHIKTESCHHGKEFKHDSLEVDFLTPAAMENLYYTCHNAADCLELTGFGPRGRSC
uniref:Uncharacterized protein n=1 Tax=Nothobranchius furzeri TaxID=105023 RepID=A0A8C6KLF1_NOTFU